MSSETTEVAIVDKKREAWGVLGVSIHEAQLTLIATAEAVCETLANMPEKIEDIEAAEALIKDAKAKRAKVHQDRKEITGRFDAVVSKLMDPEKSIDAALKPYSEALIAIKKKAEQEAAKDRALEDEKKFLHESFSNQASAEDARILSAINNGTAACLKECLEKEIAPEAISGQLKKYKDDAKGRDWRHQYSDVDYAYVTKKEYEAIKKECVAKTQKDFLDVFCLQLDEMFSDYTVAFENKKEAIAMAEREKAQKAEEIRKEQQNKEAAAKLESSATNIAEVQQGGKALKKSYEIEMEETVENAILIMAAFVANADLCLPKLKVNKWFSFTPKQAGIALGKVKCDNNGFQPKGIIFKEVAKL